MIHIQLPTHLCMSHFALLSLPSSFVLLLGISLSGVEKRSLCKLAIEIWAREWNEGKMFFMVKNWEWNFEATPTWCLMSFNQSCALREFLNFSLFFDALMEMRKGSFFNLILYIFTHSSVLLWLHIHNPKSSRKTFSFPHRFPTLLLFSSIILMCSDFYRVILLQKVLYGLFRCCKMSEADFCTLRKCEKLIDALRFVKLLRKTFNWPFYARSFWHLILMHLRKLT